MNKPIVRNVSVMTFHLDKPLIKNKQYEFLRDKGVKRREIGEMFISVKDFVYKNNLKIILS